MKTIAKWSILPFIFVAVVLLAKVSRGAPANEKDDNLANLCEDGCFCDDITPYLIDCKQDHLIEIYDPPEWELTLKSKNLTDVDLDVRFNDNKIKAIPAFPPLRIVSLSFRKNLINKIEDHAFAELDYLLSLDLSQNNFTAQDLPENVFLGKMNNSFYKPIPLQHLNLSRNYIHSIEKDLFDHLPALTSLDLSNNPIRILGGSTSMAISSLRKLQYLSLANCQIRTIPEGMIHDLRFLSSLDLSGNELTAVPSEVRNAFNLTVLILDDNRFESLDAESFIGLTSLTSLSISNNGHLKIIEERTFSPLKNLLTLECHHNKKLTTISDAAFYEIYMKEGKTEEWPVKEISFNDNALTHLDKALAQWESIHYVDIQNNPFRCDCNLQWMVQTLVHQIAQTHEHLAKDIVCSSPPVMKGNSLVDLSIEPDVFGKCGVNSDEFGGDVKAVDEYHTAGVTVLTIGIILIVIGVGIIGVIVVKRRAIASALVAHQEIRYKRADMDDGSDGYRNPSSQVFKVTS